MVACCSFVFQFCLRQDVTFLFSFLHSCLTGTKLSEDSRKYGAENTCTSGATLSRAALNYGRARAQMEKERGNLIKALGTQVINFFKLYYMLDENQG